MQVNFKAKQFTFDRKVIKTNWKKINETPMKRAGMKVRLIARRSIRVRKSEKPSPPGEAPRSRAPGKPLKMIFSVPNQYATETIVGPVGFNRDVDPTPAVHEFGEAVTRTVFVKADKQRRTRKGRFRKAHKVAQMKKIKYAKRPFMRPALELAAKQFPELWKNSIK